MLRRVVVNLRSDKDLAYQGALWAYRGSWLTLRDVMLLREHGAAQPMIGEFVVHRDNVAFLQVMP
jgi:hypothetical protein